MEKEDSITDAEGDAPEDGSNKPLASNSNHSTTAEEASHDEPLTTPSASSHPFTTRKFLRNAPRPDQWESFGDSVLNHLGRKNAYNVLSKAVSQVRAIHSISPKAGPGRKSNTVHALLFYNYLLDRAREFSRSKPDAGTGEEEGGNDDDGGSNVDEDNASLGGHEEEFATNQEEYDPLAAFTDEEFIAHHKTVCEVCEDTSSKERPLLLCSTCRLVFHIACSRPVLEGGLPPPEGERWRCSYCVLASEPKNTKPRRVAAAAVRLMARMRNQHKRNRGAGALYWDSGSGTNETLTSALAATILRRGKPKALFAAASTTKQTDDSAPTEPSELKSKAEHGDGREPALDVLPPAKAATHGVSPGMERRSNRRLSAAAKAESENKPVLAASRSKSSDDESGDKVPGTPTAGTSATRRSLELQRLGSPGSAGEGGESLGKRVRKQPTLYNPQDGPARQWKSDEILPPSRRSSTSSSSGSSGDESESQDDDDDDQGTSVGDGGDVPLPGSSSRTLRRGHGSGVWCNFCFDEPGIKVCCFCACRVCFGKKSRTKLLICDMCNDEYHTYCLQPPLQSVPTEAKWFCPTCAEANERRAARTSSRLRTSAFASDKSESDVLSPRRTSTRIISPPKKDGEISSVNSSGRGSASGSRRPRGRPRKHPLPDEAMVAKGKKRGRPPGSTRELSTEPPRKRGRPPKSKPVPPHSPGRASSKSPSIVDSSEKAPLTSDANADTSESPMVNVGTLPALSEAMQIPVTVSRSGRTVKRSSFHDEVDEGDQHLRTGRVGTDQLRKLSVFAGEQNVETSSEDVLSTLPPHDEPTISLSRDDETLAESIAPVTTFDVDIPDSEQAKQVPDVESSFVSQLAETSAMDVTGEAKSLPDIQQTHSGSAEEGEPSMLAQEGLPSDSRTPRRKPGARECMQLSRRFGAQVISDAHVEILMDYCKRGKCEHLIRMRERLDEHSRFLESQLAGLEALVLEEATRSQQDGA